MYNNSQVFLLSEHFMGIDAITNCICISLQFHFMHKYYYMLCGKLHNKCFEWSCWCLQMSTSRKNSSDDLNINVIGPNPKITTQSIEIIN